MNCCNDKKIIEDRGFKICHNCGTVHGNQDPTFHFFNTDLTLQNIKLLGTKKFNYTTNQDLRFYRMRKTWNLNINRLTRYENLLKNLKSYLYLTNFQVRRSFYLFNKITEENKNYRMKALLMATCVYVSCLESNRNVNIDDIISCYRKGNGINLTKTQLFNCKMKFNKYFFRRKPEDFLNSGINNILNDENYIVKTEKHDINPHDYIGIIIKVTRMFLDKLHINSGHFPHVICASTMYFVTLITREKGSNIILTQQVIAKAFDTTPLSIRNMCKVLKKKINSEMIQEMNIDKILQPCY